MIKLIASGTDGFWNEPVISQLIVFSKWANMVVFAVTVIFMLFDMAEEYASGKDVDYSVVFTNTLKALLFAELNSLLAEMSMSISDIITTSMKFKMPTDSSTLFQVLTTNTGNTNALFDILMLLVVLIAVLVFFIMSVMRYGAMFVLILTSSMYIPDILRGDTTSMGSWLRQMVAIAGTYIFQYITFYTGLLYLLGGNIVMCAILWAGMASASKILEKFGYSTGTRGVFSAAGSLAGQGLSLLTKV